MQAASDQNGGNGGRDNRDGDNDDDTDDDGGSESRAYEFYDFTREVHLGPYISTTAGFRARQKNSERLKSVAAGSFD